MIKFMAWIFICALIYLVPASIGAFINLDWSYLDWSYLDFTLWTSAARTFYCIVAIVASIVVVTSDTLL